MAEDLADRLDDLICAWDKVVGTDFETLVLLLLGWLGFGGVVFLISHLIYSSLGPGEGAETGIAPPPPIPPFSHKVGSSASSGNGLPTISVNNNHASSEELKITKGRPTAVGSDTDVVQYVNKCWECVYSNQKIHQKLIRLWLEKLNDFTKRSALDDGLLLEFLEIPQESPLPTFQNMTADSLPNDNMSVSSDISARLTAKIKTSRPIKDDIQVSEFMLVVDKLRARFSLTVIKSEKLIIGKLDGWPDLKLRVESASNTQKTREEESLHDLICEIAASAIRGVQLDLRMEEIPDLPVFVRTQPPPSQATNTKLSNTQRGGSKPYSSSRINTRDTDDPSLRLLDVKVVKAIQLGGMSGNCLEPYVVLEVDDPSQRNQTRPGTGPQTQWDETFTIDISSNSSELLFEVWDQGQKIGKSDTFMGLGIVSVSELMVTASQRHVIPLQGRPYEEDQVTGMLTIEFLFQDGGITFSDTENLSGVHRSLETRQTKTTGGSMQYNKKTTYSLYEPHIPDLLNGADVADMALKELEVQSKSRAVQPTKSTMLIHAVQRPNRSSSRNSDRGQVSSLVEVRPESGAATEDTADSIGEASIAGSRDSSLKRGRKSKRNLISTIKKRFSGTARSLSNSNPQGGPVGSLHRGYSLDRVRSASEHRPETNGSSTSSEVESDTDSGCSVSLASWKGQISLSWETDTFLTIPGLQSEDASSMSDISGISTASNKTYVTEDSSLVLETLEDGRHHHYLIPSQVARRGRFKKKGVKLHIFLDHIFVARHIKLGTHCFACDTLIPMRLGKQAYVCRDCGLTTHKPCHVKIDTHCLHTSLPSMELEYYSEVGEV